MDAAIQEINRKVQQESLFLKDLRGEIARIIVGQDAMVDRVLVGLLADGHLLIEGVPGLAKTLMVKTLAQATGSTFSRIQFTPDLLPADIVGTLVFSPKDSTFSVRRGPVFAQLVIADEINRAPAKTQSALLEAMQERQVTIGDSTLKLPEPFLVLATQNPIEQEGTYPLPEAQIDRFMLKIRIGYPSRAEEGDILERAGLHELPAPRAVAKPELILAARRTLREVYMDEKVKRYVLDLVFATRDPAQHRLADLKPLIQYGASPRASIFLAQAARAFAFLSGRGFVTPEDVKEIGPDVLRHRLILSYEAEAEGVGAEDVLRRLFETVEVP